MPNCPVSSGKGIKALGLWLRWNGAQDRRMSVFLGRAASLSDREALAVNRTVTPRQFRRSDPCHCHGDGRQRRRIMEESPRREHHEKIEFRKRVHSLVPIWR